jgi:hypothetical protein
MRSIASTASRPAASSLVGDPAGAGGEWEVWGLDPAATMAFLVGQRRAQDESAARELRAVAHWAELHRVDTAVGVGAVDPEVWRVLEDQRAASAMCQTDDRAAWPASTASGLVARTGG